MTDPQRTSYLVSRLQRVPSADRTEEIFRALLESAPDAMVIADPAGRIVFVNESTERLFGYSRDELLSMPVEMLVPERFRRAHVAHRHDYFEDSRVRPMGAGLDLFGLRKDGTEFPVEISLSPLEFEEQALVSSAIRDITDRKAISIALAEKNAELEYASLAKDRFLASMSHELRTPLNAIIGFTGTLLMKLPGPLTTDQEQQLQIIQSSARHLLSLINDILDLAKIQSGKAVMHFEPVSVAELVDEVVVALRSLAVAKGLGLGVTVPSDDLVIATDRRALKQILINLVSNAIKYTEAGSVELEVTRAQAGDHYSMEFAVMDTGVGIDPQDQPRLFDAFEQLDQSSTRRFEGAGLGLYLSKRLADLLGAGISVVSEKGKGSTFTLSLPA